MTIPSPLIESIFFQKCEESTSFLIFVTALKEINNNQTQDPPCLDGIKLNVIRGQRRQPRKPPPNSFLQVFTTEQQRIPKSFHYKEEKRVVNQQKGRETKGISSTFNKENLELSGEGTRLSTQLHNFHSNVIKKKSSLVHGRINLYFKVPFFLLLVTKGNKEITNKQNLLFEMLEKGCQFLENTLPISKEIGPQGIKMEWRALQCCPMGRNKKGLHMWTS